MFVSSGAVDKIRAKRKAAFYEKFIVPLIAEAANLDISRDELTSMIEKVKDK
jgi:DNA-binding transcriptional regulator YhcF (GntR family)